MGLFHRDFNMKLNEHIQNLEKFDFLPENWIWYKEKVLALRAISKDLIEDLIELHKRHQDSPVLQEQMLPLLQELEKDLEAMANERPTLEEQKKKAATANNLFGQIKKIFSSRKQRLIQLESYGLNIKSHPDLAEFLLKHWDNVATFVNEMGGGASTLFSTNLPDIKKFINETNWPKITKLILLACKRDQSLFRKKNLFISFIEKNIKIN